MSEAVMPLGGAAYDGMVNVREIGPQGMITVRGDLSSAVLKNVVTGVAGVDFPDQRQAACAEERGILWMSPDELLVLCPYAEAATAAETMAAQLAGEHALAVNVSDARAVFQLQGAAVRDVLAKLAPADMRASALPVGEVRRTRLAQVPAAFWLRDDDLAQVICFRSVAEYTFKLLATSAHPGGDVGYF